MEEDYSWQVLLPFSSVQEAVAITETSCHRVQLTGSNVSIQIIFVYGNIFPHFMDIKTKNHVSFYINKVQESREI